jgi:hypothetical protein
MKKVILSILIFVLTAAIAFLIFNTISKIHNQKYFADKIKKLPDFSFLSLDNTSFSSSEIKEGPALIVHFHPECEHCKNEISELLKSNIWQSGTTVILVSNAIQDSVIQFLNKFSARGKEGLITLIDTGYVFGDIFGKDIIPSNFLYDRELNLIDVLYGEYKIETILKRLSISE